MRIHGANIRPINSFELDKPQIETGLTREACISVL